MYCMYDNKVPEVYKIIIFMNAMKLPKHWYLKMTQQASLI